MDYEQRQHLEDLRQAMRRRLRALEVRAAEFGMRTPPEVQFEIEDIQKRIARLEEQIAQGTLEISQGTLEISAPQQLQEIQVHGDANITVVPNQTIDRVTQDIKRHVVQIEVILLVIILFQALLSLQDTIQRLLGFEVSLLLPFLFLSTIPIFIRVVNPESSLRSRLTFGLSGAGIGGTIGGSLAGLISGGLGAPAGTLIGAPIGFVVGAIVGPYIDGVNKKTFTQGEAREYLIKKRSKYPHLPLETIIHATEKNPINSDCTIYMFLVDGVVKCTKGDVDSWLKSECWKKT